MAQPTHRRPALAASARLTGLALGMALATLSTSVCAAPQGKRLSRQALPGAHINWTLAAAHAEGAALAQPLSPSPAPAAAFSDGSTLTSPPRAGAAPNIEHAAAAPAAPDQDEPARLADAPSAAPTAHAATDANAFSLQTDAAPLALGSNSSSTLQQIGSSLRGLWASMQSRFRLAAVYTLPGSAASLAGSAEPSSEGGLIRIRSGLQSLPDYAVEGGFRATAGLVRAEGDNWWTTHNDRYSSNGYQRLNASGVLSGNNLITSDTSYRTVRPYLGAGYSSRLVYKGSPSLWRFNADLGLLSVTDPSATRLSQAIQPERTVDDVLRDIRLRPTVKVSLGYSF